MARLRVAPRVWPQGSTSWTRVTALSSGQYPHWTKNRTSARYWWSRCRAQTWDHLFEVCSEWKAQQKILQADVWGGRWGGRAGLRCGRAVPGFLAAAGVRGLVPAVGGGSGASEWDLCRGSRFS